MTALRMLIGEPHMIQGDEYHHRGTGFLSIVSYLSSYLLPQIHYMTVQACK